MRYDKPVYFQLVSAGVYDESTGDYGEDAVTEVMKRASVTDSGIETMKIIYGEIRRGSLTIRLQNHYTKPFNRIRVGNQVYGLDFSRKLRTGHVFVVSKV